MIDKSVNFIYEISNQYKISQLLTAIIR